MVWKLLIDNTNCSEKAVIYKKFCEMYLSLNAYDLFCIILQVNDAMNKYQFDDFKTARLVNVYPAEAETGTVNEDTMNTLQ